MSYIMLYTAGCACAKEIYTTNATNTCTTLCCHDDSDTYKALCVAAVHAQHLLTKHSIPALAVHVLFDERSSNIMIAHLFCNLPGSYMIIHQNCTSQKNWFVEPSRLFLAFVSAVGLISTIWSRALRGWSQALHEISNLTTWPCVKWLNVDAL